MSKLLILSLLLIATTFPISARILNDVTQIPDPIPLPDTDIPKEVEPVVAAPITITTPPTNVALEPIPDDPSSVIAPMPDLPKSNAPPLTTTTAVVEPIPDELPPVIAPVPDITDSDAPPVITPTTATSTNNVAVPAPILDKPAPILDKPAPIIAPVAPVIAPVSDIPDSDAPPLITPTTATSTNNVAVAPIPDKPAPIIAPTAPDLPKSDAPPLTTPAAAATGGAATTGGSHPSFSFFMHDILGGSHPSGRAVAGIVASSDANNLPFSKSNNQIFPINGGVPLNTVNGVVNNNNLPFLVGLNGSPSNTLVQNNGNNNAVATGGNQPFVTAGQLPAGLTLQQLTFGSVTAVDNELTAGHELGSAVLGRAQGLYLTSSDGSSSHTLLLTAMFHGGEHAEIFDTLSFFGVHRTATPISNIAIVGGTGKYENAKGFAAIESLPHVDQHVTDGVETITHFTIYLTP